MLINMHGDHILMQCADVLRSYKVPSKIECRCSKVCNDPTRMPWSLCVIKFVFCILFKIEINIIL